MSEVQGGDGVVSAGEDSQYSQSMFGSAGSMELFSQSLGSQSQLSCGYCEWVCVCVLCACARACMHACVRACMYVRTCICMWMKVCSNSTMVYKPHTNKYTHMHAYTHTHTHTRTPVPSGGSQEQNEAGKPTAHQPAVTSSGSQSSGPSNCSQKSVSIKEVGTYTYKLGRS